MVLSGCSSCTDENSTETRYKRDRVCSIQSYMGSGTEVIASNTSTSTIRSACALYQQKFCLAIMSSTSKMHQAPQHQVIYILLKKNGVVLVEC